MLHCSIHGTVTLTEFLFDVNEMLVTALIKTGCDGHLFGGIILAFIVRFIM